MYFWHVFKWSAHFYYNYFLCSFGWFKFMAFTFNWVQTFGCKAKRTKNSRSEARGCTTRISVYNSALPSAYIWLVLLLRHMVTTDVCPGQQMCWWVLRFNMYQLNMLRKKLYNKSKMSDRPKSCSFPTDFGTSSCAKEISVSLGIHIYNSATTPLKKWEWTGLVF